MRFDIITIFPKIFDSYLHESILKRAQAKKKITITTHDLRDFSKLKHRKVDDSPFGGGPGMVLMAEPIFRAVEFARRKSQSAKRKKVILFSTRGKKFDAKMAKRLSRYDQLILICGRYEGVDERVAEHIADEEISIGNYVLSGGELPAMVLVEAISRFIPGVLGKYESLEEVKGSYPVYTRPEVFVPGRDKKYEVRSKKRRNTRTSYLLHLTSRNEWRVPKVLLSGHAKRIEEWRMQKRS